MQKVLVGIIILVNLLAASVSFSGVYNEFPPPEQLPNDFPALARALST
jgi:hypothetical protein